jgi:hypothetical protein
MNKCKATGPAQDSFLGTPWRSTLAGGFAVGLWFAAPFGDDVGEHEHEHAHLMIVLSGSYHSPAAGANRDVTPIVLNPPRTSHRDRFLTRGTFMSIAAPSGAASECLFRTIRRPCARLSSTASPTGKVY